MAADINAELLTAAGFARLVDRLPVDDHDAVPLRYERIGYMGSTLVVFALL